MLALDATGLKDLMARRVSRPTSSKSKQQALLSLPSWVNDSVSMQWPGPCQPAALGNRSVQVLGLLPVRR